MDQLVDYTIFHFQAEEGIWHQYFPDDFLELEHKKTHDSFVETISQTKRKIDLESEDRIIEVLVNLILALYEKFSVNTLNLMRELKYRKEQYCIRPKRS